jgi:23S rRNA pseudouridine1911/1915/1917 synthase
VVAASPDWVVLDKPPGVPVSPTVDNWRENCLVFGAGAVGDAEPLLMTHRLDMVTSGVFVMGRAKKFVSYFNCLLQKGKAMAGAPGGGPGLSKEYRALCASPPPLGRLVHHVRTNTEVKGSATYTEVVPPDAPGALRCELEVVSVAEVPLGPRPDGADWDGWGATGFEARIRLFTGRTHQIRVQLAATGSPILGDCLYTPSGREPPANLRAPRFRIGLQSAQLTIRDPGGSFFTDPEATFEAGPPWWRKEGRD